VEVHPEFQRDGVGRSLINKLKSKLSYERRNRITLKVRESNLDAQLFFRAMGFQAVEVLRNHYQECSEDAYLMRYQHRVELDSPKNRISQFFEAPHQ